MLISNWKVVPKVTCECNSLAVKFFLFFDRLLVIFLQEQSKVSDIPRTKPCFTLILHVIIVFSLNRNQHSIKNYVSDIGQRNGPEGLSHESSGIIAAKLVDFCSCVFHAFS